MLKRFWIVSLAVCASGISALGPHGSAAGHEQTPTPRPATRRATRTTAPAAGADRTGTYNVKAFGAKGDGRAIDTAAINRAIDAAAAVGGGTVRVPAGSYLSFSIHLKSHVALYLDQGAAIVAAQATGGDSRFDPPEPNAWDKFQDFGHSHWHNSLIWGEENTYPEPTMFGPMPAYGFFIRHVRGLVMNDVEVSSMKEDQRPAYVLTDVKGADFHHIVAQHGPGVPTFSLANVEQFSVMHSWPLPDTRLERVQMQKF